MERLAARNELLLKLGRPIPVDDEKLKCPADFFKKYRDVLDGDDDDDDDVDGGDGGYVDDEDGGNGEIDSEDEVHDTLDEPKGGVSIVVYDK